MNILQKIIPVDDLKRTMKRFPYSAVCSVFLCALIVLDIHDFIETDDMKTIYGRLILLSAYGFFWFGLSHLVCEGLGWPVARERILSYSVFAILAGLVFFWSGYTLVWLLIMMIPTLLLGLSVAPYLSSNDNLSLWFYNRQVWQGAAIAVIAGLVWALGIVAAMASIRYLFDVRFDHEIYADVWVFAFFVFVPLYALSWVPEKFSYTDNDCHAPPQLAFVLNWVLAPLVFVYMLILYAYFIKIALVGELPRGQLSYMVSAFGGVGVFTYLAGWPLRDSGGPFFENFCISCFFRRLLFR